MRLCGGDWENGEALALPRWLISFPITFFFIWWEREEVGDSRWGPRDDEHERALLVYHYYYFSFFSLSSYSFTFFGKTPFRSPPPALFIAREGVRVHHGIPPRETAATPPLGTWAPGHLGTFASSPLYRDWVYLPSFLSKPMVGNCAAKASTSSLRESISGNFPLGASANASLRRGALRPLPLARTRLIHSLDSPVALRERVFTCVV